ncbi:MAG: phosphoenolpyruvate synthase [Muribaculaceae bacterium]|nr:phosphoenolpyruvate synthase [Muribaculaceae bacterium]
MNEQFLSQLYLKDTAFQNLMSRRVYTVLLVASTYDAFIMEEDGRVEEQIYNEYVSLNLSTPPRVVRVSDYARALDILKRNTIDLIIAMPGIDISETFSRAREIKELYADIPFVVLTPFSREVSRRLEREDLSAVDYVFSWLGNVDLLVAIIKLLEDKMNAPSDVNTVGVQMILLVEDSVRFYSSILPTLYRFILRQSQTFAEEALNAHERMLRMRGRPKVMLARDYEEAVGLYRQYGSNILGVISDVSFKREGVKDPQAGIRLAGWLREQDPYLPLIVESSESRNREAVTAFGGIFLDKNSKKLPVDLGNAVMELFGFGDFVIRDPESGNEIMRITDLQDLQKRLNDIPAASLFYHARHNDISRWLYSRALFPIAQVVKMHRFEDIDEAPAVRSLFLDLIAKYRKMKNRGVVAEFKKGRFDRYSNFARIGQGSLGGKGRGLAFIDNIIKHNPIMDNFEGVVIKIPHTVVLCTDIFDRFMAQGDLYQRALSDLPDEEILSAFLAAPLPAEVMDDLAAISRVIDAPLAVRSSSLLEDSHYQPFAGVYATYMVAQQPIEADTVEALASAVKAVYASVFYRDSKAYMTATSNVIDQEKMAVIIQEVVGKENDGFYYPSFSAVGRSVNYYPLGNERAADGVVELAVGLGRHIVDGGLSLRFSPRHPKKVLQTSTLDLALRDTQTSFSAIDLHNSERRMAINEEFNIAQLPVQQAADAGYLQYMVSTYDAANGRLVDNDRAPGRKVVTFANVLRHNVFPLAHAVDLMLNTGQEQMGRPVEIELAGNIAMSTGANGEEMKGELYWLQIRPMIDRSEMLDDKVIHAAPERMFIYSANALGHGMMDNITAIVMAKPEMFSMSNNEALALEIERVNRQFAEQHRHYLLIGVGRWGSSDHALGVPVKWAHISQARLVVELSIPGKRIEPSQGTHFFQNLTSMGVGYLTVGSAGDGSRFDRQWLEAQPAAYETSLLRVISLDTPLPVAVNGITSEAVVLKP